MPEVLTLPSEPLPTSSLSDFKKLISYTKLEGFDVSILAKKKLFFEELILVKAVKLLP